MALKQADSRLLEISRKGVESVAIPRGRAWTSHMRPCPFPFRPSAPHVASSQGAEKRPAGKDANSKERMTMLYPKNRETKLSDRLFAHPTSEYRAAPF